MVLAAWPWGYHSAAEVPYSRGFGLLFWLLLVAYSPDNAI